MPKIPAQNFPFCDGSYLAASPVLNASRSINLYPEKQLSGAKSPYALIGRPGLTSFADPSSGGIGRGMWVGSSGSNNGRLFVAAGSSIYELSIGGGTIGTYTGLNASSFPVKMVANGQQLLAVDPSVLGPFIGLVSGGAVTLEFHGTALEYLDGFYVAIATGASLVGTNPNQINSSAFLDGTNWLPGPASTPAYAIRTGAPDIVVQLATLNSLLWIFGRNTTEIWYNAGLSPFPFARINGGQLNVGCQAPYSVVAFENTIMWLGGNSQGYGKVYMAKGTGFEKVSTKAIEGIISTWAGSFILAYGYSEAGHTFYCLLPQNSGGQPNMLVYDLEENLWHERVYTTGQFPVAAGNANPFGAFGGLVSNFTILQNGKVCNQSITIAGDQTSNVTYTRTCPHLSQSNEWMNYARFELDGDIGTANPILNWSNDGGRNFGSQNRSLQQNAPQGDPSGEPEGQNFFAWQLGRSRDRVFQVTITDNTNLIRIANAYVTVEPGTEGKAS